MNAFPIKGLVIIVILCLPTQAISQTKLATIKINNIRSAYIDRPGDLYILQENDSITKFDIDGKLVHKISLNAPTNFEPRDGSRYFFYFKFLQQFGFLAGNNVTIHNVQQHYAIEPIMACASGDNNVWMLDQADWSLKRINPSQSKIITDALIDQKQFNGTPEFIFMREYQNFLFVIEKNTGIIIFNSIGHQIKKIVDSEITTLNFLGEELYYKRGDRLIFYDLFDASEREMKIDPACKYALLTDLRRYLVYQDKIEIFENP